LVGNSLLSLRTVAVEDDRLLWQWANDPHVRAMSFSSAPISWEKHVSWLGQKLTTPGCYLWIASYQGLPIGQVRFDQTERVEANISISLAPETRGKGYGQSLIQIACQKLFQETDIHTIHAYIKVDNSASIHAFEACGFIRVDSVCIQGCEAFHYQYSNLLTSEFS
jgi:UDP-2,4-diacetamido-2,4,6-trideoxy-beta-L-altropyranose hydrolase